MSDYISRLARNRESKRRVADALQQGNPAPAQSAQRWQLTPDDLTIASSLFDEDYYLNTYADVAESALSPLPHFIDVGFKEGRRPNPYFDPLWYWDQHPDVRESGMQPLVHYAKFGDIENRQPSAWFNTKWYRENYKLSKQEPALLHYIRHRFIYEYNPIPEFDTAYYVNNNPDVRAAGIDAFQHFMETGFHEGRNPSPDFDLKFYSAAYMKGLPAENPLLHYIQHKNEPGVYGRMPDQVTIPSEVKRFTRPGPDFEPVRSLPRSIVRRAKILAYYLPQFHSIPENDGWWGTGFTEWTNTSRGLPRFEGHYQPRVPRDLGFYSLDSNLTMRRQVEMALGAGIYGFLFYYYRFGGKRLLEKPIEAFLADPKIEINFALIWANENWTRRWDGLDSEVLIAQSHSQKDEPGLLEDFARHFADRRYIRIEGRPLLVIYRPGLIPDGVKTFNRWRAMLNRRFGENPIIAMAQGFGELDPTAFGLDGAMEFPPHKVCQDMEEVEHGELGLLDPNFPGRVLRYDDVVHRSVNEAQPTFPLIRTAIPSWDNDARQQGAGTVIAGSTPQKYEAWLAQLIANAVEHPFFGEPIVCVNAWNEWSEAAYLEPDQYYGAAYLNATARAAAGIDRVGSTGLLLVGHDANPHGAQEILLNVGRALRHSFGIRLEFLLLEGGPLVPRHEAIAKVNLVKTDTELRSFLAGARERGFSGAIVNTVASAHIVKLVTDQGLDCIVLVHELPRLIKERNLIGSTRMALQHARKVIFTSATARDEVLRAVGAPASDNFVMCPQGVYKIIEVSSAAAKRVRKELGVAAPEALVVAVGYADLRKGFDLFIQLWRLLRNNPRRTHFLWVGRRDAELEAWLQAEIDDAVATGTFHLVGQTEDVGAYYSAADAFLLTSREDPFPSVVLEALTAGLPVLAFDRSGGIPDLLREYKVGVVVPYGDITSMASALRKTLKGGPIRAADRAARRNLMDTHFNWKSYVARLLGFVLPDIPEVTVAVPNYNYAQHLNSRLGSIFKQTLPIREILVLDDCSTDDSLEVAAASAADWDREIRIIPNRRNSGSVFAQWRKAAELAQGELLWIAEADDEAEPDFLARLCAPMKLDPGICLTFSDSRLIDTNGGIIGRSYKQYYSSVEPAALSQSEVFEGAEFVERFLSVKNLILNVSSVVWRRTALLRALDRCGDELLTFRMAGDWRLYLEALLEPGTRVAYEADPLNVHRRHGHSITHALDAGQHVEEISRIHGFTQEVVGLTRKRRGDQSRYLTEIAKQLGAEKGPRPVGGLTTSRPRRNKVEPASR
jgi:glycosyltransferase involved in cell wall biosynthesis